MITEKKKLIKIGKDLRKRVLQIIYDSKTSHLGSCFSCIEILTAIYFSKHRLKGEINNKIFLKNSFILSKGHAAPALYAVLEKKRYITKKMLNTYCQPNSYFEEHPNINIKGVLVSSGSLGHGLSYAAGLSLGDKIRKKNNFNFVLMSDGECNEGSVWEASMFITGKKLKNILVFIDCNRWQATEKTNNVLNFEPIDKKWSAFGWKTKELDGHNTIAIANEIKKFYAKPIPTVLICRTLKGKGVSFMENNNLWHYRPPDKVEYQKAFKEIDRN